MSETTEMQFELVESSLENFAGVEYKLADAGYRVTHVRGDQAGTVNELFAEFASAFQFPWYFGRNWPSFRECMTDLDEWLPAGSKGYVLTIWNADLVLAREAEGLKWLIDSLVFIHEEYAEPTTLVSDGRGQAAPAPAKDFRVLLHCETGERERAAANWRRAGAQLSES
ncbi:barstar family protein [Nocardia otitidiscaviarum]|uniref:barstar family protein n=1 Tax=Nocardia otitidiscaviarum TaxID=1823 RepID=UPI0018931280|nr:barstar family protein [Nocardia otitidiscaviarum]MBF6183360.1 barstar family protein [Nocardia otitidiscaviarum]